METLVLGDGDAWIRRLQQDSFPQAAYVLDWYHLKRKVWEAF